MTDPFDTPPDAEEMKKVMEAMMAAFSAGSDYIAPDQATYFRYAVPIMKINGAERVGGVQEGRTGDGRRVMLDVFRAKGGNEFRMGYEVE